MLIDGLDSSGFTGVGSYQFKYTDTQLSVGLDPSLTENFYTCECVLMMKYLAQTFPLETLPDEDTRPLADKNITSCTDVIDPFCQASLSDTTRSFDDTGSTNSSSSDDICT
jgi:hypothetical protein